MWFRYLIFFIFVYLVFRGLRSFISQPGDRLNKAGTSAGEEMVKDPNCNTYIPLDSAIVGKVNGRHHYFCSKECLNAYKQKV